MTKEIIWKSVKEPLRLLVLSIIPILLVYFQGLPYEWAVLAVIVLRFADKLLHELGKTQSPVLLKGITRF